MQQRFTIIRASLVLLALLALCAPASAAQDEDKDMSVWEKSRQEHLEKRRAHTAEKREFYNKYKKRLGSNKYRQKAREFYDRQDNIYGPEYGDDPTGREKKQ